MTFNDPPKSKPGATEQEQVYALYKYLLETSAKLNLLQQELSAGLTASDASGASDSTVVDAALSDTSSNPVRNSAVSAALAECAKTDDLDAYLPLTGGTLTGSVTVDGEDNALAHQFSEESGAAGTVTTETFKASLQAAYSSDEYQNGAHLAYQVDDSTKNALWLYSGKTVLAQDLEDADGVPYVKGSGTRKVTHSWAVCGYITNSKTTIYAMLPIGLDWNITALASPKVILRKASGGYITDFDSANSDVTVAYDKTAHGLISIKRSDGSAFDATNNSVVAVQLSCTLTVARDVS